VKASTPGPALGTAAESALLALAIRGEAAAFSEIVRRRQSWVRNLLRRLCRDPALADDLAQQTFLQAWRSLHSLKTAAAFAAWLRKLALNAWLQHLRAAQGSAGRLAPAIPEPATTAPVGVQVDLDRALAQLREPVRLCVVLAYHEGLSHGEISTITALPLGTVKSHIKRGAEQLRSLLCAYNPQQGDHDER
jgi:RNA polymerase sigma-70 factor (ECF subfamily)